MAMQFPHYYADYSFDDVGFHASPTPGEAIGLAATRFCVSLIFSTHTDAQLSVAHVASHLLPANIAALAATIDVILKIFWLYGSAS
jgi:hypothetical protein